MPRAYIDTSIERRQADGGFHYPLGVYPLEDAKPADGFVSEFEPAEAGESFIPNPESFDPGGYEAGDWDEWPDRMLFEIQITANRLAGLVRMLLPLLPGRVFPILDVIGSDAYREIDPFIAYEPVGVERIYDGMRFFGEWLLEDGMVGFGAMSLDPFVYLFVDEHKILTVRVQLDLQERVEKILRAFGLNELPNLEGVDAVHHEHRSVLDVPPEQPDAVDYESILLQLRDLWLLQLNVDPTKNLDDEGRDLGITAWRCLARCAADEDGPFRFAEVFLTADSLDTAERMAADAVTESAPGSGWLEIGVPLATRLKPDEFAKEVGGKVEEVFTSSRVRKVVWSPEEGDES